MDIQESAPYPDHRSLLQDLSTLGELMLERAQVLHQLEQDRSIQRLDGQEHILRTSHRQAGQGRLALIRQEIADLDEALEQQWTQVDARSEASLRAGIFIPWIHVVNLFQLSRRDQALLVCALQAALDTDTESKETSPGTEENSLALATAARLLGGQYDDRIAVQQSMMSDAMLCYWQLIALTPDANIATLNGGYRLDPVIAAYLLAQAAPQLRLEELLKNIDVDYPLADQLVDDGVKQQLQQFIDRCGPNGPRLNSYLLHLQGPDLTLESSLCAATFQEWAMSCVELDSNVLLRLYLFTHKNIGELHRRLRILCRNALLCNRILVLTHCQVLCPPEQNEDLLESVIHTLLESQRYIAVLNGPAQRLAELAYRYTAHEAAPILIKTSSPDTSLRRKIWQRYCTRHDVTLSEALIDQVVAAYPFTEEQIAVVLKDAVARQWVDIADTDFSELLFEACRDQSRKDQFTIAQEVKTPYRFSDIVLPGNTRQWLQEVLHYAQNRHQVIEDWGFAAKHHNSKNLCVLFYGPSGTGKTMSASILANELNLGLYKIDLASVLSKYIGETEKHLAQLFDQAEAMNIVLFFDEAESLFSKRTETKDAHDRYANLQTGYLLQRIENYPGIVILSTNLLKNMDKAFTRRFRFMIEYPFPAAQERYALWKNAFPADTPLSDNMDFSLLADKAALSGGNINNIAVRAAFYASAERQPVAMQHILKATEREYDKLGKVFSANDFSWYDDDDDD